MSENESAVVNEATEILGGKNSWTSDDLRRLEKKLRGFNQSDLAEGIRARRKESDRRRAEDFVGGVRLKTHDARALEKSLAKDGHADELVRRVRNERERLDTARAVAILGNAAAQPDEMFELAKSLAEYKQIGYARRVLKRARTEVSRSDYPKLYIKIFQKSALYTYKDPDLPLEWRLERAFKILGEVEDISTTNDIETLGLAGAIYKRKWESDGKRQNLERSLFYYLKGFAQSLPSDASAAARIDVLKYLRENPECETDASKDQGYNAVNAAFVLDLMAAQEDEEARRVGVSSESAAERRAHARLIRRQIVRTVPPLRERADFEWLEGEWWYYATIGEAFFGLGEFDEAIKWLIDESAKAGLRVGFGRRSSAGLDVPEWEYESTARQLAQLARLECDARLPDAEFEKTAPGRALSKFLRNEDKAVRSAFRGKFGLGLSGGGFRASLYHIGVLARLAEMDVLRNVEVLSCVSGGSIIGAYYYLEVRHLLQTKTDDEITKSDYVAIVRRCEERFLRGVQRNIRTRVLAGLYTNLKMIFLAGYSRTLRVGELYERELYSEIEDGEDGKSPITGPRWLRWLPRWTAQMMGMKREERWIGELQIYPKQEDGTRDTEFKPRDHNWRRQNKAPILVLNAASLNTGHNWQFTTSFMGEPPAPINANIDANYRLRRLYYKDAPRKFPAIRLGHAVAASSCVPGLFEPLILDDLYPDEEGRRVSVRLVDGGVCDNQGITSLLEQDCTVLLISDGSGQMDAEDIPSAGLLGVPLRSNSILQARVRESQYDDIASRRSAATLRGLLFVHLKQDLLGEAVDWRDCPPELKESDFEREMTASARGVTSYGVDSDTQKRLAAVRTDLDSFCDAEAYALMACAYRMTARQFQGLDPAVEGFDPDSPAEKWRFNEIERAMAPRGKNKEELDRLLDVSSNAAFKIWKLSMPLIILKKAMLVGLLAVVVWAFYLWWKSGTSLLTQSVYERVSDYLTFKRLGVGILYFLGFTILAAVINALVGAARGKRIMQAIKWRDTLKSIVIGIVAGITGVTVTRLHLYVFDRLYLRYGKIEKFK
jgi:predicted acylesterase/phospholipase RssA